jgi:hypothetical protein
MKPMPASAAEAPAVAVVGEDGISIPAGGGR